MGMTTDVLKTKISTHKDQIAIVALTAAITAAFVAPIATAANDNIISVNDPATSVAAGPSCDAPSTATSAKKAVAPASHGSTTVNNQSGNSGSQNANSGQGNANNTTGGSSAANGNNQTNTGGLVGGVNVIAPISALNNNNVANDNQISALNTVTSVLSTVTASL